MEPRGRRFQDAEFEVSDLAGRELESVVGYSAAADDEPALVVLKPSGLPWQRCFLDAGLAFWEEWSEAAAVADVAEPPFRRVDYGERFGLRGAQIHRVRCEAESGVVDGRAARIVLSLSCGELVLGAHYAQGLDGELEVAFLPAPG